MPLIRRNGKLLKAGAGLASSLACCCATGLDCQDILDNCPPAWMPAAITISDMDRCPCLAVITASCNFSCTNYQSWADEEMVSGSDWSLEQVCESAGAMYHSNQTGNFWMSFDAGPCANAIDTPDDPEVPGDQSVHRSCIGITARLRLICDATPPVWRLEINTYMNGCAGEDGKAWLVFERAFDPDDPKGGLLGSYACVYDACATASGSVTVGE